MKFNLIVALMFVVLVGCKENWNDRPSTKMEIYSSILRETGWREQGSEGFVRCNSRIHSDDLEEIVMASCRKSEGGNVYTIQHFLEKDETSKTCLYYEDWPNGEIEVTECNKPPYKKVKVGHVIQSYRGFNLPKLP